MDLDQYLEKMNTNTEFIWIQIIEPPIHEIFLFINVHSYSTTYFFYIWLYIDYKATYLITLTPI